MANKSRNLIPEAKQGLNKFKLEIASAIGISNYDATDKGQLTSRQNGQTQNDRLRRIKDRPQNNLRSDFPFRTRFQYPACGHGPVIHGH